MLIIFHQILIAVTRGMWNAPQFIRENHQEPYRIVGRLDYAIP
jgi:hypothetical protein